MSTMESPPLMFLPFAFKIPGAVFHGFVMQWSSGAFWIYVGDSVASFPHFITAMVTAFDSSVVPSSTALVGLFGDESSDFAQAEARRFAHMYRRRFGVAVPSFVTVACAHSDPQVAVAIRSRLKEAFDALRPPSDAAAGTSGAAPSPAPGDVRTSGEPAAPTALARDPPTGTA
eukprot:TRINITY_DN20604_c0_g1_i1.p2 TRINITY_DN20604_c0_g1~~TRINITY_DN20604_c0_g1_i1.p2  ORF type:complete len:173 (+),score=19.74 TRINITY_DN20604_c0_g1_i1:176-694(+)